MSVSNQAFTFILELYLSLHLLILVTLCIHICEEEVAS